jgi:site-specific DNA recombinase
MAEGTGNPSLPRPLTRCAIYTRKSTEEGLEQEFNSLDAQRESAEAYIRSQQHEGWRVLPKRYDDPGYSGGTMERPALAGLLADIKAGHVDCVVVYKVDRLSRSLLDFARIMAAFDQHHASFVSVTQQFNTSTSLGRLTLNILFSFAHYAECAIMQSQNPQVAFWLVSQRCGTPHYPGSSREAISASGALNRPRRKLSGTTASTASNFSVGSTRRYISVVRISA